MNEEERKLRSESKLLTPEIIIGKNGLTPILLKNIQDALKRKRLLKIKMLKTFIDEEGIDKKAFARELAIKTNSTLIDQVGFMIVLAKR